MDWEKQKDKTLRNWYKDLSVCFADCQIDKFHNGHNAWGASICGYGDYEVNICKLSKTNTKGLTKSMFVEHYLDGHKIPDVLEPLDASTVDLLTFSDILKCGGAYLALNNQDIDTIVWKMDENADNLDFWQWYGEYDGGGSGRLHGAYKKFMLHSINNGMFRHICDCDISELLTVCKMCDTGNHKMVYFDTKTHHYCVNMRTS